jgi:hypothetical protein
MKVVSCNYTGNIPGVGRGPVTNVKISDALCKQLANMGFSLQITVSKAEPVEQPRIAVTKSMHVPSLEEKRAATLASAEQSPAKISPLKKSTEEAKAEEPKEEVKVEETVEQPAEVVNEAPTEEAPKSEEQPAEEKKTFTKDNISEATDEELEAIIPADVKRPVRYGRKWLLKNAVNYV